MDREYLLRKWPFCMGLCILAAAAAHAADGDFEWATRFSAAGQQIALGVATDPDGNVYTTGTFADTVDFDPGPGTSDLVSAGSNDVFVSKLDASGNFAWAVRIGSTGFEVGQGIAVGPGGDVYVTGATGSVATDFDPGPGVFTLTPTSTDGFVLCLDSGGNFVWAGLITGTGAQRGRSIAVNSAGAVHVTGMFSGTADFDPGPGTSSIAAGGLDYGYVVKLDAAGGYLWAIHWPATAQVDPTSISVDGAGNVFTTGKFTGTCDFDPGPGTFNVTPSAHDVFVVKLDADGIFQWMRRPEAAVGDEEYGWSIAADAAGNSYTLGHFRTTNDFDPGLGTANLASQGNSCCVNRKSI